MDKIKVLFVCIHNSGRSQIAEAFLNNLAGDRFAAESAGIDAGILNPFVVESMKEAGIDISSNKTKSVFDFYKQGRMFSYVITVCEKESADRCPIFLGVTKRIQWFFSDPAKAMGTREEKLKQIAVIRDEIKAAVEKFISEV
jgi:arsenate reductase